MKVTLTSDVAVATDYNHTFVYRKGEEHEIGSDLMPGWLVTNLVSSRQAVQDASPVSQASQDAQAQDNSHRIKVITGQDYTPKIIFRG